MESVWVVIAAYNEEGAIGKVIEELLKACGQYHVVVVNDGSSDRTLDVAGGFGVHLLNHSINLGQGAALGTGIEYALGQGADFIVTFDADGQMQPADIAVMIEKLKESGADVALGSRFLGELAVDLPRSKKIMLKLATVFTQLSTGLNITDTHNGFRAFKSDAARKISITQNKMAHASEILSQIARNRLKIVEVPVHIRYTEYSKAKGQSILNSVNILFDLFTGGSK